MEWNGRYWWCNDHTGTGTRRRYAPEILISKEWLDDRRQARTETGAGRTCAAMMHCRVDYTGKPWPYCSTAMLCTKDDKVWTMGHTLREEPAMRDLLQTVTRIRKFDLLSLFRRVAAARRPSFGNDGTYARYDRQRPPVWLYTVQ